MGYVPEGWQHAVVNLGETVAVGVQGGTNQAGGWLSDVFHLDAPQHTKQESERLAAKLVKTYPGLDYVWVRLADFRLMMRGPAAAVETAAANALSANAKNLKAQLLLARAQLDLGKSKAAGQML